MKIVLSQKTTKAWCSSRAALLAGTFFASYAVLVPQLQAEDISSYKVRLREAQEQERGLRKEIEKTVFGQATRRGEFPTVQRIKSAPSARFGISGMENFTDQPEYARRSDTTLRCYAVATHSFATKMFGANGEKDEVVALNFNSSSLKFSDIAFDVYAGVNNLHATQDQKNLVPFYTALNEFTLNFESRKTKTALLIGASKKIFDNYMEIGFEVPVEQVYHKLRRSFGKTGDYRRWVDLYNAVIPGAPGADTGSLWNNDIEAKLDAPTLSLATPSYPYSTNKFFPGVFYGDLSLVLDTLLTNKKLEYRPEQTVSGIGNIGFYVNALMDNALLGIKVDLPCTKEYPDSLWKPELGNGGYFGAKFFGSYAGSYSPLFNPHVYAEGAAYVSNRKSVRLSPAYVNPAIGVTSMKMLLLSTPYLTDPRGLSVTASSGTEVKVSAFSSKVVMAHISRGPEFSVSFGNIMENIFMAHDKLDVTYTFYVKGNDDISGEFPEDLWDVNGFRAGTCANSHKFGFLWTFYDRDNVHVEAGGSYIVAGKNVAQQCDIRLRLEYEF